LGRPFGRPFLFVFLFDTAAGIVYDRFAVSNPSPKRDTDMSEQHLYASICDIASELHNVTRVNYDEPRSSDRIDGMDTLLLYLARIFEKDDHSFDRDAFLRDCGVYS
jgi:hypothetical protein